MLEVTQLTKTYRGGQAPAVADVSFKIGSGELLSLVGESGSGKTTLLRMIAGLEVPDGGTIQAGQRTFVGQERFVPPEHRRVGLVFQGGVLFPHMTVAKNLAYAIGSVSKRQRLDSIQEHLELVQMERKERCYPHELSGGERQRIALVRTLIAKPDLILLDEPYSNLDVALTADLREQVKSILVAKRMTGILVTHDPSDARHFADRIAIMRHGNLIQLGKVKDVVDHPCDAYCSLLIRGHQTDQG